MSGPQMDESANRRLFFFSEYLDGLKKCMDTLSLEQIAEVIGHLEEAYR